MYTIIPAIIPESREHLARAVRQLPASASVQIDVVDGQFVPYRSWPYSSTDDASLSDVRVIMGDREFGIDLMVEDVEAAARQWLIAGADRLVVHLESVNNIDDIYALRTEFSFSLGFSISNDSPPALLEPHATKADFIQLMGIKSIGTQGQPFDGRVLTRIKEYLRMDPEMVIQIDGSVNPETLPLLIEAGATRFVVGSAIFGASDPTAAYENMTALAANPPTSEQGRPWGTLGKLLY